MFEQIAPSINIGCIQSPWPKGCRHCTLCLYDFKKTKEGVKCVRGRKAKHQQRGQTFFTLVEVESYSSLYIVCTFFAYYIIFTIKLF